MASKKETLEYLLKFEKDTGALKAAGIDLDVLTAKTGKDQPEAAGKAAEGYKKWLKGAKEDVHLLRAPLELLHKLMGAITGPIALAVLAWNMYQEAQRKVKEETEKNLEQHLALIKVYEDAVAVGVRLTQQQRDYYEAIKKLVEIDQGKAKEAAEQTIERDRLKLSQIQEQLEQSGELAKSYEKIIAAGAAYDNQTRNAALAVKGLYEQQARLNGEIQTNTKLMRESGGKTDDKDLTKKIEAAKKIQDIEAQNALAHSRTMLEIEKSKAQDILGNEFTSGSEKLRLIEDLNAREKDVVQQGEAIQEQDLKSSRDKKIITEAEFQARLKGLKQSAADQLLLIDRRTASDREKIELSERKKLEQNLSQEVQAFSTAFNARLKQTHNLNDALAAAGEAAIETGAGLLQDQINKVYGPQVLAWCVANFGPIVGFPLGLAAWGALTTAVGAAGGALGGAVGGGGGDQGGPASGSSISSGGGAPAAAGGPLTSMAAAAQGGRPGEGTLVVNLYLERDVILRLIQRASFSGELQISANAITS